MHVRACLRVEKYMVKRFFTAHLFQARGARQVVLWLCFFKNTIRGGNGYAEKIHRAEFLLV